MCAQAGAALLDEGDGREGREQRDGERDVDRSGHAGHHAKEQQRRDSPGPDQLHGHHPVCLAEQTNDVLVVEHAHVASGQRSYFVKIVFGMTLGTSVIQLNS